MEPDSSYSVPTPARPPGPGPPPPLTGPRLAEEQSDVRVPCKHPGCNKTFRRREHLNRHIASHDPTPAHKCYICDRSFARKDILRRHVLQHDSPPDDFAKRTRLACETCRRRKVRCDSGDPCSACQASKIPCVRRSSGSRSRISRIQTGHTQPRQSPQGAGPSGQGDRHDEQGDEVVGHKKDAIDHQEGDGVDDEEAADSHGDDYSGSDNWNEQMFETSQTQHSVPSQSSASRSSCDDAPRPAGSEHRSPTPARPTSSRTPVLSPSHLPSAGVSSPAPANPGVTAGVRIPAMDDSHGWFDRIEYETLSQTLMATPLNASVPKSEDFRQLETLFHMLWPLLHMPTLSMDMAAPVLVQAIAHVKKWIQQQSTHESILWDMGQINAMLGLFTQNLAADASSANPMSFLAERTMSQSSLQVMQALGLVISSAITGNNPPAVIEWAVACLGLCTAYLRQAGVFQATRKIEQAFHTGDERWILEEQFNRLATHFLRLDSYLGIMLDQAPTLQWSEMGVTFPSPETIWRVTTPEERRVLLWHQPAGRSSMTFRTILRDGLMQAGLGRLPRPKLLLLEDYNLAFCAFLSDVWQVRREVRLHDHQFHTTSANKSGDMVATWTAYLLHLRSHMEMNYDLEATFFTPDYTIRPSPGGHDTWATHDDVLVATTSAINLIMYHMLQLMMVADLPILETAQCCEDCQDAGLPNRLRAWAAGPNGRRAVVHAAQLRRIHEREACTTGHYAACLSAGQRQICNPLRAASLFYGAVVLCSYADRMPCVHDCPEAVELVQPEVGGHCCEVLERWVREGDVSRGALLLGTAVCRCLVPGLAAWYQEQLGTNWPFTLRFMKFQRTLLK